MRRARSASPASRGRQPVKPGPSFGDTGTGMLMAITILGALLRSARRPARATVCRSRCRTRCCTTCAPPSRPGAHRQGRASATARSSGGGTNTPSGLFPARRGGPNDYVYVLTQPRQSRALVAAVQGDGARGSDRRSALRDAGRAREERGRGRRDDRRLDETAQQARGDGA